MDPEIENILSEGRQAHVAVVSPAGPHVTPELYAWSGGRLWFWFAHTTLKASVLAREPSAAALVSAGGRSAVIEGVVDLIDVRRPLTLVGSPLRGLRALAAMGGYIARNAADLGAFVRDVGSGRLGRRPPPTRILASLEPRQVALLGDADRAPDLRIAPSSPAERVVVALPGPLVLPGRWFADDAELWIDPDQLDAAGVGLETPIAIVADRYVAPGPAAKTGTLLRGTATRRSRSRCGVLSVVADTLTSWDGVETATHRRARPPDE